MSAETQTQSSQGAGIQLMLAMLARQLMGQDPNGLGALQGADLAAQQQMLETALKPQNKIPSASSDKIGLTSHSGEGLGTFYDNNPSVRQGEFDPYGSQTNDPRSRSGTRLATQYATEDAQAQNALAQQGLVAQALDNYRAGRPIFGQQPPATGGQQLSPQDVAAESTLFDDATLAAQGFAPSPQPTASGNEAVRTPRTDTVGPGQQTPTTAADLRPVFGPGNQQGVVDRLYAGIPGPIGQPVEYAQPAVPDFGPPDLFGDVSGPQFDPRMWPSDRQLGGMDFPGFMDTFFPQNTAAFPPAVPPMDTTLSNVNQPLPQQRQPVYPAPWLSFQNAFR